MDRAALVNGSQGICQLSRDVEEGTEAQRFIVQELRQGGTRKVLPDQNETDFVEFSRAIARMMPGLSNLFRTEYSLPPTMDSLNTA